MKDIRDSSIFQTWTLVANLILFVQCFILFSSAVMHGVISLWQGMPVTIDSAREIATSGMPLLASLNTGLIPT